ncbi:uncharacterized protein LOC141685327 [Apium graveolens]|uniref:uncharacterized protein LOC141685327 n=1 Tax=Apium graveolens TaxID=4045 RepID=UPI003D78DC19
MIFTRNNPGMFDDFKKVMTNEFGMTDIGQMSYFLGVEVKQNKDGIFMCQKKYAEQILKKFRMEECKPICICWPTALNTLAYSDTYSGTCSIFLEAGDIHVNVKSPSELLIRPTSSIVLPAIHQQLILQGSRQGHDIVFMVMQAQLWGVTCQSLASSFLDTFLMADKSPIHRHDQALSSMEAKLNQVEESQSSTSEQLQQIKEQFTLENRDIKKSLADIMALIKLQSHNQLLEGKSSNRHHSQHKVVPFSTPTPTTFAIASDILRIHDVNLAERENRHPPPISHTPSSHTLDLSFRPLDPTSAPELKNATIPPQFQNGPFMFNTIPSTQNPPLIPQFYQSTLNPFAPPLYPYSQQGVKTPKFDFPKFNGKDPRGWITKCEKYFQLMPSVDLRSRVLCAALHMEDDADIWYRTVEEEKHNLLWPEFSKLVCQRFNKGGYENVVGQFNKLIQKGTVDDYINQFDELRNYVMLQEGFHRESYYIDNFISGLKEEISQHLYNQKPQTLQEARDRARGQEYYLTVLDKRYRASKFSHPSGTNHSNSITKLPTDKPATYCKPPEISRRLTLAEINERKLKGLCFHCDKKFEPGHDCRKKKIYIMVGDEGEDCKSDGKDLAVVWEEDNTQNNAEGEEIAKISLHAMTGSVGSCTIKLKGQIKGKTITILVDMANGQRMQCATEINRVSWTMSDHAFHCKMNVIPLGGYDLILGVKWMATVSPVTFDYQQNNILINWQGERLQLQQFVKDLRCPIAHKEEIEKITRELLAAGVIRNNSLLLPLQSYWSEKRIALGELLAELKCSRVFTKLDLRSGYHQIRVKETDIFKTAFKTQQGHFEFMVMPFGLTNAPASFQALMNDVFSAFLRKFVLVFFDDILVYSPSIQEHIIHLQQVFDVLRNQQLFVKKSKCAIAQPQIEYLGHLISYEGVSTDQSKIAAMINWPRPKSIKGLRGFLGLTGYYRRFVQHYGLVSKPLTQLLKKGNFHWTTEADETFTRLKTIMSTTPVLALPDFSKPIIIETDTCKSGIGAVMMQEGRPIAYLSKALSPKHQGLSTYEKELLAVIMATQKWRSFFIGSSLHFQYKRGKENHAADALSRIFEDSELSVIVQQNIPHWRQEVLDSLRDDSYAQGLITQLLIDPQGSDGFILESGTLKKGDRYYVGVGTGLRKKICNEIHGNTEGGHSGIAATIRRAERNFIWPSMRTDITNLIKECDTCQRNKPEHVPSPGLLQPIEILDQAWEIITMDCIEGLPKSKGKSVILVVIDKLTKYCHLMALSHPYTAQSVAEELLNSVVKLHGTLLAIISDRDPVFVSSFRRELFKALETKIKLSTAYHPQMDGKFERLNQCVEMYL